MVDAIHPKIRRLPTTPPIHPKSPYIPTIIHIIINHHSANQTTQFFEAIIELPIFQTSSSHYKIAQQKRVAMYNDHHTQQL